jgi:murein DD-endopeptidase MepM/ murein hydrolase activator NlpD
MSKKKILTILLIISGIGIIIFFIINIIKNMSSAFAKPVKGKITSKFGTRIHPITKVTSFHNGVDIAAASGTPVQAPLDGEIIKAWDTTGSGGLQMLVSHKSGWVTGYAHLSGFNKKAGDRVKKGEVIAFVGNTGASTGPHLHFTLTNPKSVKVNPELYFDKELV